MMPRSMNSLSRAQKMKVQLTDSDTISNTTTLNRTDITATMPVTLAISWLLSWLSFMMTMVRTTGIPTDRISPQNTKKLQIMLAIQSRPSSFHSRPMVVLALSIQPSPVTAIMMTEKLLSTCRRSSMALRIHSMIQRQHLTTKLLSSLFLLSFWTSILTSVTTEITKEANTMEPNWRVKSHLQAVPSEERPSTPQYQCAHTTAIVKVIMQQKMKMQNSQMKEKNTVKPTSVESSLPWACLSFMRAMTQLKAQAQKLPMMAVKMSLMRGVTKIYIFSVMKLAATWTRAIPVFILLRMQNSTSRQISRVTPQPMARPRLPVIRPQAVKTANRPRLRAIMVQIMTRTQALIKNTYRKATMMDVPTPAATIPPYLSNSSCSLSCPRWFRTGSLLYSMISQTPTPKKPRVRRRKMTTQPTSVHRRSWQGSLAMVAAAWEKLDSYFSQLTMRLSRSLISIITLIYHF